jgi:DNA polymerase-3 subunit gamma/tau
VSENNESGNRWEQPADAEGAGTGSATPPVVEPFETVAAQPPQEPPVETSAAEAPSAPAPSPVVEVRAPASLETPAADAPTSPGFEAGASAPAPQPPVAAPSGLGLVDARRMWPDVLDKVREMRRFTWILLSQNAQVIGLDGDVLTVGFKTAGAKDSFIGGGSEEILRQAAIDVIGADWRVEAIVDPSADPTAGVAPVVTKAATAPDPEPVAQAPAVSSPPAWVDSEETPSEPEPVPTQRVAPETIASARSKIAPTHSGDKPAKTEDTRDQDASPDDPDVEDGGVDGAELLARELGATVVEEIPHD